MSLNHGKVYLVGAGPGDPGLLTRRGAEVLALADVVIYDHLASARLLDLAPPAARRICAGKSSGHCVLDQDQIHALMLEHSIDGKTVVRLKGGDPLVFGRGAEEAELLSGHGIPFEIVPGVTAGVGVTAYAGIPVTHRGISSAVAFVTGHGDPEEGTGQGPSGSARGGLDWSALARFPGTLVVYMGVTYLPGICRTLIREGRPGNEPAVVIESGTLPRQRLVEGTLATIAKLAQDRSIHAPALLLVGPVASKRTVMRWYENRPLFGQRIVVTRPLAEARASVPALEALGAEVLLAPAIEIRPISNPGPVDEAVGRLDRYDWIVFTSANGVRFFLDRLLHLGKDLRSLGGIRLAAIGPGTAQALFNYHLRADLVPPSFRSESLVDALLQQASGDRILLARADRGRQILKEELEKRAEVDQVAVYQNADADELSGEVIERIEQGDVDWITLTSSAIAARFHALLPDRAKARVARQIGIASLSPVTSGTIRDLGWEPAVEASTYTWEGLVQAIVVAVAARRT
ncbi:MAG: uroporphyrinogen-III C-methyltransferase [Isosphaeraceae bacterium]